MPIAQIRYELRYGRSGGIRTHGIPHPKCGALPTALPDIPFFCFLRPRVALQNRPACGAAPQVFVRRSGCSAHIAHRLSCIVYYGKKQRASRVKCLTRRVIPANNRTYLERKSWQEWNATKRKWKKVIALLQKQEALFMLSSEIYGGLANSWDYGPLGVESKTM